MVKQKKTKLEQNDSIHRLVKTLDPTVLTIFGATGDLAAKYLLPALVHMEEHGLLPANFRLVCVGRKDFNIKSYFAFMKQKSQTFKNIKPKIQQAFLKHLVYFKGDFNEPKTFLPLAAVLQDHDTQNNNVCFNRLYYFATSPQLFANIARVLKDARLLQSCEKHSRKVRILVEKPFGFSEKSAQALNRLLLKYFTEEQIYRIDHYLGKETVQNLMVVRFANSLFEPLWNARHVDHVQISVLEEHTAKGREAYYDQTGALKDMVQNHLLQMLALIAMDEPFALSAEHIRKEKLKVLRDLVPMDIAVAKTDCVKGQYKNYQTEVGASSRTETFVALKAFVDNQRWRGVPFYLRTGKAMAKKATEISIHFKELDRCLFKGCASNILTFRIQPNESVHMQINNKIPGFGVRLHQGFLDFSYTSAFFGELPSAYERLLLDFMEGDQRLFISSDEVESAWKYIDSISHAWGSLPLNIYKPGNSGPKEAETWIARDMREWNT